MCPRNAPAAAVHGFFTRDGTPPAELLAAGRAEVMAYGVELRHARVVGVTGEAGAFTLALEGAASITARRILLTTGLVDELPDLPGVRELWGDQVIHCPYCHGWEVRDRRIGVIATSPMATHQALLFRQLSDDIVVFAHTTPPDDEQRADLEARGVTIIDGPVAGLDIADGRLQGVRMAAGEVVAVEIVVVAPRFAARSGLVAELGVELAEQPGIGVRVVADPFGRTNVAGVWAAGNVTDMSAQVGTSAAAGALAGAHINADLVTEDVRRARAAAPSTT